MRSALVTFKLVEPLVPIVPVPVMSVLTKLKSVSLRPKKANRAGSFVSTPKPAKKPKLPLALRLGAAGESVKLPETIVLLGFPSMLPVSV